MTEGSDEEIVTFRLGPSDRAAIQRLVDKGEFRNRSDFLRYAIKTMLHRASEPVPSTKKLDLRLEQVHLPSSGEGNPRARSSGRSTRGNSR